MSTRGELLDFVGPGLVHRLRSALSGVQEEPARGEIQGAVQVLRYLGGEGGTVQASQLLPRLVEVLVVPLQARGLTLCFQHSSKESPARVRGALLAETVAGALKSMAAGVPAGFAGRILVDLCAQGSEKVEILLELNAGSGQLPFEVDLLSVQQELQKALKPEGGLALWMGRKLSLHLPVVPAVRV